MTSTTDMAGHPDVAEISDLTEGLLPPTRTADVRRHLDECELCADVHASLEEIRGLLGTLPGPTSMPADVAGRIDAALAAEALLDATAPDSADEKTPVGLIPAEATAVSRETSTPVDRPSGHARASSTGPGRKERRTGNRRRGVVLGAVFTAAALGLGSVLLSSLNDGKPADPEAQSPRSSATDTFSEGTLEKEVSDLLAKNQSATGGSRNPHTLGAESVPSDKDPRILQGPDVPACIQKGIGRDDSPLATEPGKYNGTDVLLVVLRDASAGARVTAYVMDRACETDPSLAKADVLLKRSYSQP
ncbi:anti-sigma factor family protein [Streptomyces lincolnensis]|uniref:anti-sigma factor family protein n=1 Tax=Streptomyces lincolnensis TaxID=1915 RepID=UPI0037CF133A